jgi:hypothetical protein
MRSGLLDSWEDDDDDGLPDAAFTEDELAAGVQHVMRTGNPNATSSGRRPASCSLGPVDDVGGEFAEDAEDVLSSCSKAPLRFETYAQARAWAQANPGRVFTRASDDHGFVAKPALHDQSANPAQHEIDSYRKRSTEIRAMAPHLHDVLSKSASNHRRLVMRPFYRTTWQTELSRLSTAQLKRLRLLVSVHLEDGRKHLHLLYAEMRRFPSMKAGHYGEALSAQLNEILEGALADIDRHLIEVQGHRPLR